jgi:hypothetical protein
MGNLDLSVKQDTRTLTIKTLHSGQSGAYSDSVYQYELTFSSGHHRHHWRPTRATVLKYLEVVFGDTFYDLGYKRTEWHLPFLQELVERPTGHWYAHIRRLYND